VIVFAVAEAGAPKVEAQDRKAETVQSFHGMEDDFVMQRSAKQRVRMTNHCRMRRILRARIQQCFQPSRGAV
jgi:hypothetical protein